MQHIEQLREYYGIQQLMFEKELEKTRNQLTKVDVVRFKAEKELMYLQQKAKEKKTWDIIDQTPFLPIIEDDRIFKITKFANQNLTEAEKRQLLLQEYYRNDKARGAIKQLYNLNIDELLQVPELHTDTQLIFPKIHAQPTQVFDESLIRDLQSMKMREEEITKRLQAQDTTQIKNASEYQRMLENQTILPILYSMKNEGQRSAITPQEKPSKSGDGVKKLRSEGDVAQATFLDNFQVDVRDTQQQFDLEFSEGYQRTEELVLNESEIPKLQEQPFEYEEHDLTLQDPPDPIDENIDQLLSNIHQIVTTEKMEKINDINSCHNKIQDQWQLGTKNYIITKPKPKPKGFKQINFAKTSIIQQQPIKIQVKKQQQQEIFENDNLEKLDKLISHLAI